MTNQTAARYIRNVAVLMAAGLLILIGIAVMQSYFEKSTTTRQVISKERVCEGGKQGDCKYLVFTDGGTLQIKDALFGTTRFNSSDVYGRIREDRCYNFTVYGWRAPFLSMYENVAEVTEVPCR